MKGKGVRGEREGQRKPISLQTDEGIKRKYRRKKGILQRFHTPFFPEKKKGKDSKEKRGPFDAFSILRHKKEISGKTTKVTAVPLPPFLSPQKKNLGREKEREKDKPPCFVTIDFC